MFNIGVWEMTLILVAALLLLGPSKLPEFARWMGKALREIQKATQEVKDAINFEIEREELSRIKRDLENDIQDSMKDVKGSLDNVQNEVHQSLDPWQPPQETEMVMGDPTCGGGEGTDEARAAKTPTEIMTEPSPEPLPAPVEAQKTDA